MWWTVDHNFRTSFDAGVSKLPGLLFNAMLIFFSVLLLQILVQIPQFQLYDEIAVKLGSGYSYHAYDVTSGFRGVKKPPVFALAATAVAVAPNSHRIFCDIPCSSSLTGPQNNFRSFFFHGEVVE